MIEANDIKNIARLPGPGGWIISRAGHLIVFHSPESGNYALVGNTLYKLPRPWDGVSLGKPVPNHQNLPS